MTLCRDLPPDAFGTPPSTIDLLDRIRSERTREVDDRIHQLISTNDTPEGR